MTISPNLNCRVVDSRQLSTDNSGAHAVPSLIGSGIAFLSKPSANLICTRVPVCGRNSCAGYLNHLGSSAQGFLSPKVKGQSQRPKSVYCSNYGYYMVTYCHRTAIRPYPIIPISDKLIVCPIPYSCVLRAAHPRNSGKNFTPLEGNGQAKVLSVTVFLRIGLTGYKYDGDPLLIVLVVLLYCTIVFVLVGLFLLVLFYLCHTIVSF